MIQMTRIRVVDTDHRKGTVSVTGKYNGVETSMSFQFLNTYRTIEMNSVQGNQANFSLGGDLFLRDSYPHIGDELCVIDNKGSVLGWCYLLDYELALFKHKRKNPELTTSWMKTLGFDSSDKLTERLIKEKFRNLSKELHPDAPNGDAAKFSKLVEARDQALRSVSR